MLKLIFRPINTFDIFQKVPFPTICENPNLVLNVQETNECLKNLCSGQKQPPRCFLWERCSENMLQIYRRTPMPKCDFNKAEITLRHGCSPVNLLDIFRRPFFKNTSGRLLLSGLNIRFVNHSNVNVRNLIMLEIMLNHAGNLIFNRNSGNLILHLVEWKRWFWEISQKRLSLGRKWNSYVYVYF